MKRNFLPAQRDPFSARWIARGELIPSCHTVSHRPRPSSSRSAALGTTFPKHSVDEAEHFPFKARLCEMQGMPAQRLRIESAAFPLAALDRFGQARPILLLE